MLHANIERRMIGEKDRSANLQAVVEAHRLPNAPSLKLLITHHIKKTFLIAKMRSLSYILALYSSNYDVLSLFRLINLYQNTVPAL